MNMPGKSVDPTALSAVAMNGAFFERGMKEANNMVGLTNVRMMICYNHWRVCHRS
jgi:hypothetical protein